ncbi:hypothetical protein ABT116_50565, partial [Streptomyces sp. NPDC002130]
LIDRGVKVRSLYQHTARYNPARRAMMLRMAVWSATGPYKLVNPPAALATLRSGNAALTRSDTSPSMRN